MEMYLKGPCQGIAVVVGEKEADIDMIDADFYKAKDILETRRTLNPNRPVILLSIQNLQINNTFFIKKPITVAQLESVIAKIQLTTKTVPKVGKKSVASPMASGSSPLDAKSKTPDKTVTDDYHQKFSSQKYPIDQEHQKTAKHQTAIQLNEGGYTAFLGTLSDIDFNDRPQVLAASFDKKQFFLGFVHSACRTAKQQSRTLKLKSIWKILIIFPDKHEIWLDADDKQLRAFAGITINYGFAKSLKLLAVDAAAARSELPLDKFQDIDAFLWKLAIWTSKGRFPVELDIKSPVLLKRWPNFTRLVITPDALRIAALLAQAPIIPLDAVSKLNTKPQFVFVFISACYMLGWLEQCEQPTKTIKVEQIVETKKTKTGLLSKILNKLRGA